MCRPSIVRLMVRPAHRVAHAEVLVEVEIAIVCFDHGRRERHSPLALQPGVLPQAVVGPPIREDDVARSLLAHCASRS
jgi:hypothetical protein